MSNDNIIDVLPATAPAAVSDFTSAAHYVTAETASCPQPSLKKRSLSLGSSSGDEDRTVLSAPPKKARGRPRSTQLPRKTRKTRKTRKQDKVGSKSTISIEPPVDLSANSPDRLVPLAVQSPSTAFTSQCQDQIYHAVKQCMDENISSDIKDLQNQVGQLREMVVKLVSQVSELNSQLSVFVSTSATHIQSTQPDSLPRAILSTLPLTTVPAIVNTANGGSSNGVDSRQGHPTTPTEQRHDDAVTAMYIDQKRRQQRASNIVISGIHNSDNDIKTVTELLRSEFEWDFPNWPGVNVTSCRRIGRIQENKIQPLLVTFNDSHQSEYFIKNAKFLRGSSDDAVQSSVFINPDLTPSEARAAYELRLLRRQRRQQALQHPSEHQLGSSNTRIIYRSNSNTLPAPTTCLVASTTNKQTSVNTPSRLVWSVQQPATAVSIVSPPVPADEVIPASASSSSPDASNPVSHRHTKTQVGDSSTIVAGSSP